jgi:hypothetical protein
LVLISIEIIMKLDKNNLITMFIVGSTVVLGGIAIFTAFKLYQLRQKPTAPTQAETEVIEPTPEPTAAPVNTACEVLTFSIAGKTSQIAIAATPTSTPLPSPTVKPTSSPIPSLTPSPTPTPTAKPTATPSGLVSQSQLPEAGISLPTLVGISSGILFLIGALLLAL